MLATRICKEYAGIKTYQSMVYRSLGQEGTAIDSKGACHRKNGPGKNGPAGPNLDEKMVWPDHYWLTKIGPAGPILVN